MKTLQDGDYINVIADSITIKKIKEKNNNLRIIKIDL